MRINPKKFIYTFIILLIATYGIQFIANDNDENLFASEDPESDTSFEDQSHLVTEVIDGDTIIIERDIQIRLIGVDAPEQGECFYQEAKDALNELVNSKNVILKKDISGKDNFGRLLRYVFLSEENPFLDNLFVNKDLIEKGYAGLMPKTHDKDYRGILEYARNQARRQNVGIWSACERKMETQSVHPQEADDQPTAPNCIIKGNISKDGYGKTYFPPGCANYKRVKIDFSKGENYFCNEQEAEAAGFRKAESCK